MNPQKSPSHCAAAVSKVPDSSKNSDSHFQSSKSSNLKKPSSKPSQFSSSFFNDQKEKEEESKSPSTTSSTLSLHIASYESSSLPMASEGLNAEKVLERKSIGKASFVDNELFEFPRGKDDAPNAPEVTQFKANQKLVTASDTGKKNCAKGGACAEEKPEKPVVTKQVCALPYYHGLLPREDIKALLKTDGDFLLRITEPNPGQPRSLVLSVCDPRDNPRHFVVQSDGNDCFIEPHQKYPDVILLVRAYHRLTLGGTVMLRTPITRQPWELNHEDVECTKKIGEGAFGEVSLGRLTLKNGEKVEVAIKLAKLESLTKDQIKEIMLEARLMRMFDHPNVVKMYGVAAGQEPLMLVMELADKGALDSYLQKNTLSPEKKTEMCAQASYGLEYLHHMNVLHCDIAARNCLYGGGKVKISDFGLTREGQTYEMLPTKRVPIRWLAPETMVYYIYNQKTDIYSFGILCWEIWHNGNEPYPGMTVAEVHSKVKEGFRMTLPPAIPNNVRILILNCWGLPDKRWTALEVAKKFEEISGTKMPDYMAAEEKKKQQLSKTNRKKSKTSRESRDSVEQENMPHAGDQQPPQRRTSSNGRRTRSS